MEVGGEKKIMNAYTGHRKNPKGAKKTGCTNVRNTYKPAFERGGQEN